MTEAEAIQARIKALESHRDGLLAQHRAEAPLDYLELIDMWIDSASDEIGRLKADLRAVKSSATLVDIGNRMNLSEMGR